MRLDKIIFCFILGLLTMISVAFLWQDSLVLSLVLTALFFFKYGFFPIKKELNWFIFCALMGCLGEILVIKQGGWYYPSPELINIPIWLPLLWGLTGSLGASCYSALFESKEVRKI